MTIRMVPWILCLSLFPFLFACGQKEERQAERSKIQEEVREAVTKEFKMYEGAKTGLEKAESASQERRELEKELN